MATVITKYDTGDTSVDDTLRGENVPQPKRLTLPSRGNRPHRLKLASNRTLTSTTSAQSIFGKSFLAEKGKQYRFTMRVTLEALSATSGAFSLSFGGSATVGAIDYTAVSLKGALATNAAALTVVSKVATAVALVAANTSTVGTVLVEGTFRCTGDGTFIPNISLGVAAAATVDADSFIEVSEVTTDEVDGNFI